MGSLWDTLVTTIKRDIMMIDIKHDKYLKDHQPNRIFYGLGIENEIYLTFEKPILKSGAHIKCKRRRERYSVDYSTNFDQTHVMDYLNTLDDKQMYELPLFLNSHTIIKCDKNNEHITRYTKLCEPNPKFQGPILDTLLKQNNKFLNDAYDQTYVYDGDTFEFITTDYYCTTLPICIAELQTTKTTFLDNINDVFKAHNVFQQYGPLKFQTLNHGLAVHLSNPDNTMMCNNGTYHINITLPTHLNRFSHISDPIQFEQIHANAIRAIQLLEPLFVANYGSPDILSLTSPKFAAGSLRLALSRYISIGTFSTSTMLRGKQLNSFEYSPTHWFAQMHNNMAYIPPTTIGYDINFNKFQNHGIEIRFFDWFPDVYLESVINTLIMLCQYSLLHPIPNPIDDPNLHHIWAQAAAHSIHYGHKMIPSTEYIHMLENAFNVSFSPPNSDNFSPHNLFQQFVNDLSKHVIDGPFLKQISPNFKIPEIVCYNELVTNANKQLQISHKYGTIN